MTNQWQIDVSVRTDQGQVRDHNEDFVAWREPEQNGDDSTDWLIVVADGVGGSEAGEVASELSAERTIHHFIADQKTSDPGERLRQAMLAANLELREEIKRRKGRMATTMVATILDGNVALIANVGDSRGYHWQSNTIRQVTRDHSLVARLVEEGVITEEEALDHPRKNVILHSLGPEEKPPIDLFKVKLLPGEQLILCSDGLTRHVMDDEIATIVGDLEPEDATEALIQLANNRGGEDNISVAVLRFGELQSTLEKTLEPSDELMGVSYELESVGEARGASWIYPTLLAVVQLILIILIRYLIVG